MNEGLLLRGCHLFYGILALAGILSGIRGLMVSEDDRASTPCIFGSFGGVIMLVQASFKISSYTRIIAIVSAFNHIDKPGRSRRRRWDGSRCHSCQEFWRKSTGYLAKNQCKWY